MSTVIDPRRARDKPDGALRVGPYHGVRPAAGFLPRHHPLVGSSEESPPPVHRLASHPPTQEDSEQSSVEV